MCIIPAKLKLGCDWINHPGRRDNIAHLARDEGLKSRDRHLVVWSDFVIIQRVHEGQRQHALLLQVGLCERRFHKNLKH